MKSLLNPTDAERNARCAEVMGWSKKSFPSQSKPGVEGQPLIAIPYEDAYLDKKGAFVIYAKDHSPITKIDQALELAIRMRVSVMFEPVAEGEGFGLEMYIPNSKIYSYGLTLPDCARKIVKTVLEVEG